MWVIINFWDVNKNLSAEIEGHDRFPWYFQLIFPYHAMSIFRKNIKRYKRMIWREDKMNKLINDVNIC